MRFVSQLFQPLLTIPKNAKIKNTEITCKSQKLLLECGLIRPTSSGLFALLPLARRALDKLEALVKYHIEAAGGQRVSLPALTSAALWEKTERITAELLKVEDRHGKKFVLAPTHEEAIADMLADVGPLSYKQLPLLLYQISDKYRDEPRPKHGLLRTRSFRMLDAYGAHTAAQAPALYRRVADQYAKLFETLQLPVHRVSASCGEMGGSESHEWQLPAPAGEDRLAACGACGREGGACGCGGETELVNSIEVGHTFILGTRYSEALGANYVPPSAPPQPLVMSCYGIGITRLLGASLEALSTDSAMRWPDAIAPYRAVLIGPKEGSKEWSSYNPEQMMGLFDKLSSLPNMRDEIIYDDRHHLTVGKRILMADKMGYPLVIVCGKSALECPPRFELLSRGEKRLLTLGQLMWELQGGREGENKMKILLFISAALLVCGALAKSKKDDNKVKIAVYYESLCPDSKRFITDQLAPVWRDFRGAVKVKLVPYGKSTHDKVNGKWQFNCHHGPDECYGNKIQACILKDRSLQDTDKMELVICLMGQASPDKSLDTCLEQVKKLSESPKLKACASGDQGDKLLASYGDKSDTVQRPLAFVPTIVVNERFDQAVQDEAITNLKAVICRVATTKPAVC